MKRNLMRTAVGLGGGIALGATLLTGPASADGFSGTSHDVELGNFTNITAYDNGVEVGFAQLTLNGDGTQTLEICNIDGTRTDAYINVADASGNATAQIIDYTDWAEGGCFVRTLGYPIRKIYLTWYDATTNFNLASPWLLSPSE
jgi:hypothetical protein